MITKKILLLLAAIWVAETGGQSGAILGDGGKSLGPLQISRAYHKDAGVPFPYEWVSEPEYAARTVIAYWKRWCPDALRKEDLQTLARVHNGGPNGAKKKATLPYWHKVQKILNREKGN